MKSAEDEYQDHDQQDHADDATADVQAVGDESEHAATVAHRVDYTTDLPNHMLGLPRDQAGRPIPAFVEFVDGVPDFRLMSSHHLRRTVMDRMCWVCGQRMGRYAAFVAGPMCLINLNSAEPPSHYDCAFYAATHCPFLVNPNKVRREANLPAEGLTEPAGVMIRRNPGVTALIVVTSWTVYREGPGVLFNIGTKRLHGPADYIKRVEWYREGREATRAEVVESIASGLPALAETCDGDPACLRYLASQVEEAQRWLP